MFCNYRCHEVGGPWIAENPECPIHGNKRPEMYMDILQQVRDAVDGNISEQEATDNILELFS